MNTSIDSFLDRLQAKCDILVERFFTILTRAFPHVEEILEMIQKSGTVYVIQQTDNVSLKFQQILFIVDAKLLPRQFDHFYQCIRKLIKVCLRTGCIDSSDVAVIRESQRYYSFQLEAQDDPELFILQKNDEKNNWIRQETYDADGLFYNLFCNMFDKTRYDLSQIKLNELFEIIRKYIFIRIINEKNEPLLTIFVLLNSESSETYQDIEEYGAALVIDSENAIPSFSIEKLRKSFGIICTIDQLQFLADHAFGFEREKIVPSSMIRSIPR